ncbi:DUF4230 domain-containing protein [Paenibacillus xylaniclasticus]|uniref:DUF4230 domain-containing protein n=1 Tax=Paenibacillus xylaniclasticus TaxID=588083 RepID=UPI000FD90961|nr:MULTISPECIES: DUF4230 domain-containing protein [Paenibacillus]GFN32468.1 hypothetical protein PCURB6_27280 [Paenibacillus curdlanolyticus]
MLRTKTELVTNEGWMEKQYTYSDTKLISLDIPFDAIEFRSKTEFFRTGLSMEDKQRLYTQFRAIMEQEILNNEQIKENTYDGAIKALTRLLENIPYYDRVVIQPKIV